MRIPSISNIAFLVAAVGAVDPLGRKLTPFLLSSRLISIVDLTYAKYSGQTLQNGVNQWLSVRFAAPPTGTRRFSAPQAPLVENATQDATKVCKWMVFDS